MSAVGLSTLADGPAEVRKATRFAIANGSHQIKIMAGGGVASLKDPLESVGYSEAEMRAAVEAASDYDTYVCAHAYNDESVKRCIRAGVKDIVHGHLISEEVVKMMAENSQIVRTPLTNNSKKRISIFPEYQGKISSPMCSREDFRQPSPAV